MKKKSIKSLIKKADELFSIFIRQRGMDENGYTHCITCGKSLHWKYEAEAGHYIGRDCKQLRWNEVNVNIQCTRCNRYMHGNLTEYANYIIRKYNANTLQELHKIKHQSFKLTREYLENIIAKYK